MTRKQKKVFIRILIAAVLVLALLFIPIENPWLRLALFMVPYLVIGYDILRKAFLGVIHGEVFDENFLMAVATVGAILLGEYTEGVAVMLFYQIGELFQSYAVGKSLWEYREADGYPSGLCQHRGGWQDRAGGSGRGGDWHAHYGHARRKGAH